jgi:WD40 repeat protein
MVNAWDKQLEFWSPEPPQRLNVFTVPSDEVQGVVAPDGQFVLANDGGALNLVEVSSKSKLRSWPSTGSPVGAFHPSRSLLLVAAADELALIEAATRRPMAQRRISGTTEQVGFDANGMLAFVKQTNGEITIIDALSLNKEATLSGHDEFSRVVVIPSCRTVVTTSRPGKVRVWSLLSEAPRFEVLVRDEVPRISVSPDCRWLAITGDDLVRLVDLVDAADLAVLKGHQAKLTFARFLTAPTTLLTADTAGVIHRWPLPESTAALVSDAGRLLPRRLTADQERQFGLR